MTWHFRRLSPGESIREPILSEFFAADAVSNPGIALIREGIQNALDAHQGTNAVRVRIFLSGPDRAISAERAESWIGPAWPHFTADGNGLHSDGRPDRQDACRFLTFEDFETSGLTGDPTQPHPPATRRENHFFNFFRAEGFTEKTGSDRGSWGVGKHVFWQESAVSTVFAFTRRCDDQRRLLMGKSILRSHAVDGNELREFQDGYYGEAGPNGLVLPEGETGRLDQFCRDFQLSRVNESGLSVVVLWPSLEVTGASLLEGVIRDYFYAILSGQLEVEVDAGDMRSRLTAATLTDELSRLTGETQDAIRPVVELARWARGDTSPEPIELAMTSPTSAWKWTDELFPADTLRELQTAWKSGQRLAIRVPITVRKRGVAPTGSYFEVFIQPTEDGDARARPTFIREGIIVSKVDDAPRTAGTTAIVVAEDQPLSEFLRTAENPSHTEWHKSRVKSVYKSGMGDLKFVARSVHEIVRALNAADREEAPALLADFFSIPAPPDTESAVKSKTGKTKSGSGATNEPHDMPKPRPSRFRVTALDDGFVIQTGDPSVTTPAEINIRLAYDLLRGNPLMKYRLADFDVGKSPIRLDPSPEGVEIDEQQGNGVRLTITSPKFRVGLRGFDVQRDLYIKATAKGDLNASS